jgi:hypothetical protein
VNTTKQFRSSKGHGRRGEVFEPDHRAGSGLDAAVVLFDHVVQILRRAQICTSWQQAIISHFVHRDGKRFLAALFLTFRLVNEFAICKSDLISFCS